MRITCPTCAAQYDVDENDIEVEGQDVQCSDCLTIWMQTPDGKATNPRPAEALAKGETIAEDVEEVEDPDENLTTASTEEESQPENVDYSIFEVRDERDEADANETVEIDGEPEPYLESGAEAAFAAALQQDDEPEDITEEFADESDESQEDSPLVEPMADSSETSDDTTIDIDDDEKVSEQPLTWGGISTLANEIISDDDSSSNGDSDEPLEDETDDEPEETPEEVEGAAISSFDDNLETDDDISIDFEELSVETSEPIEETESNDSEAKDDSSWNEVSELVAAADLDVKTDDGTDDAPIDERQEDEKTDLADEEFSDDTDDDESSIWDEIAEMAKGTDDDETTEDLSELSPPIQSEPVTVEDTLEGSDENDDDAEHPWEAAAEEAEEFTDFVWSDPSKEPEEEDDFGLSTLTEALAELDEDKGDVPDDEDTLDEDGLSKILNEQIAIEDELDDSSVPQGIAIDGVPEELIGRRARVPDISALKTTLQAKSIPLNEEEAAVLKPVRRFRRGFLLVILVFLIFVSVYIGREQLGNLAPAIIPLLDTYAGLVDILRLKAEVLDDTIVKLAVQGFDWVMAKVNDL